MFSTTRGILLVTLFCILMVSIGSAALFSGNKEKGIDQIPPINVSCVGDSITEWSGYPTILQTMLGDSYEVGNFGVAGAAVSPSLHNSYVSHSEFNESKNFAPSIVIIMLGTNDVHTSQSDFTYNYRKLVLEYKSLPSYPRILLVEPPPIYDNEFKLNNIYLDSYVIPSIERIAYELGLPMVDVNGALANHPEFFEDGVHPNAKGALAIASEIVENIGFEN
jgi:lysophospholipase L1-like esterase